MSAVAWPIAFALGGVGALLRFVVDGSVAARVARRFPYGTLVVNLSGALALGIVSEVSLSHRTALLVGTATIGAYTTFSTWMFESQRLGEDGQTRSLATNLATSLALGVAAAALGRAIGGAL